MNTRQTTLGISVIVAGIIVFLANINFGMARELVADLWPVILIVAGIFMLWGNPRNYVWPLVVSAIGVMLLFNTLGVADVNVGSLIFPVILLGIGVSIIRGANGHFKSIKTESSEDTSAFLGGSSARNTSDDYKGGAISALMGGIELDLSHATIKKEAVLHVSILMGGLELRVADDVIVVNRTQAILGGVENKTLPQKRENAPTLVIEGSIIMGGIEVKR
jgi:hypothetical protein